MIEAEIKHRGRIFRVKYLFQNKLDGYKQFIQEDITNLTAKHRRIAIRIYGDITALYVGTNKVVEYAKNTKL